MTHPPDFDSDIQYCGFISYSTRYTPWVEVLHANLERCLAHHGETGRLFLDKLDIATGKSWVVELHRALESSRQLILVVTPEALASRRVQEEWDSRIADRPNWKQHLQLVRLVDTPLPGFFKSTQWADFTDHDQAKYRDGLQRLVAGLLGLRDPRARPELPAEVEVPDCPRSGVPPELRSRLVDWIAERLPRPLTRNAVSHGLKLPEGSLEDHPSAACAASAALVYATGDDDPLEAARRSVTRLLGAFQGEAGLGELESLKTALDGLAGRSETGLVRVWLDKVCRDNATLLPTFGRDQELTLLDRVFVQLALRPEPVPDPLMGSQRTEGRPERLGLHKPLDLRDLLALDPEEHPWVTRRWVVRGDPGSGKTTLVRYLARSLAQETRPRWVPVYESLPRLMADEGVWLLERLESRLRREGQDALGLARALEQLGDEGRLLLLLDGLDELGKIQRGEASELLRGLSDRWPQTPIIVTTRPIGYQRPGADFHEADLLPLDPTRQRKLLARWLGRRTGLPEWEDADELLRGLAPESGLRELAANPLYLTLMALLYEDGKPIHRNRPKLFDDVFRLLMEGKHRDRPEDRRPIDCQDGVRRALVYLGFSMTSDTTSDNLDAAPLERLESRLYESEADPIRSRLTRVPAWSSGLRPFLDDLAERTGILGPHDGPDTEWRFWHRTFREALAAEELAARFATDGREAVLDHARSIAGDESRWAEPYALLTGQVDDPDTLVKALVKENQALGLRALATAQTLTDETIVEVLELSDNPEERTVVYLRLPELIDDPSRLLPLIDRLRRRTRNGDDLYHLDLLCEILARRHGEHAAAAQALRSRLYDHIPAPPEGLFENVETLDGVVDLWCEIPAGDYLIGTPRDEHAWKREPVPYQATLKQPVRLSAVPVTQAQYRAFDPDHSSHFKGDDRPVERVSWWAALAFCRWLASHPVTSGVRLPTEEEWEIACRAGTTSRYWSGDGENDLDRVGWYRENSRRETHPVGRKPANHWGLYDVHGNVWEWTVTLGSYPDSDQGDFVVDSSQVDPADLSPETSTTNQGSAESAETRHALCVIRGGSCWDTARGAHSDYRGRGVPWTRDGDLGFRVLLPLASPETVDPGS